MSRMLTRWSRVCTVLAVALTVGCGELEPEPSPESELGPQADVRSAPAAALSIPSSMNLTTGTLTVDESWQTVTLPKSYASMVVIATPAYAPDAPPLITRVRNASGNQFQVRVQRFDGGVGVSPVPVHYLVVSSGKYTSAQGLKMEAIRTSVSRTDFSGSFLGQALSYHQSYSQPVVLGQVMTQNDPRPSVFWSRGPSSSAPPSSSSLYIGKHVGEDRVTTRASETIGYIVFEAGVGTLGGVAYEAGRGLVAQSGSLPLAAPGPALTAVVSQTGMLSAEGSWAVLAGPEATSGSALQTLLDEDNMLDTERAHPSEAVAFFALNPCPSASAQGNACGNAGACRADMTCGPDADADGVCDESDACPGFDDGQDSDGDGTADGCDACSADIDCDDGNPCTIEACGGVACLQELLPEGTRCAGGLCGAGTCQPSAPVGCNTGDSGPGIFSGSVVVDGDDTAADLAQLEGIYCVTGDLTIQDTALTELSALSALRVVHGSLLLGGYNGANYALTDLSGLSKLERVDNNLWIRRTGAASLAGLERLDRVGSTLHIDGNAALTSLEHLRYLVSVGTLNVWSNPLLTTLSGLSKLTQLLNLGVLANQRLVSFAGLENLTSISGGISINYNPVLSDLTALAHVQGASLALYVLGNAALPSLAGFQGLTRLQGNLNIRDNPMLTSLVGLDSLETVDGFLTLSNNYALASLEELARLSTLEGELSIVDNASLSLCEPYAFARRLDKVCNGCGGEDSDGDGLPDQCDRCPTDNPDDANGDQRCDSSPVLEMVSVSSEGVQGNGQAFDGSDVSDDGRFVVFKSDASNMVFGDNNAKSDIFLRDRTLGTTTRISLSITGGDTNGMSYNPSISADGRFIAFVSQASNLVTGDTNNATDAFLFDRETGVTERISLRNGVQQGASTIRSRIAKGGNVVIMDSQATLDPMITGSLNQGIYAYDRTTRTVRLASRDPVGVPFSLAAQFGRPSANGRYVVFACGGRIYLRDLSAQSTTLVSVTPTGAATSGYAATVSENGRYVAIDSTATDLVPGDTNGVGDIFVRDMLLGITQRISVSGTGAQGEKRSTGPDISADGMRVLYSSEATVLGAPYGQVMLWDAATGLSRVLSQTPYGSPGKSTSFVHSFAANGLWATFGSIANDLVPGDLNGVYDTYLTQVP